MKISIYLRVSITLVLITFALSDQISWQISKFGYWAKGCDFTANDFKNVVISSDLCGQKCSNTVGCSHYSWSTWNGGTCWLKNGVVSQSDSIYTNDFSMICGILSNSAPQNRQLIWSDEFNIDGNFNKSNWNAFMGNGNNVLQYYTNSNSFTKNGFLTIEARKENINSFKYTSSKLISVKSFKYGIFEARLKLPKGAGTWPSFLMLSSNNPPNWPVDGIIFNFTF